MANITPVSTALPMIQEGGAVSQAFGAELTSNETLVSLKIIKYEQTPGIIVGDTSYHGSYESVFDFGSDAIKYREGDELKSASSWSSVPDNVDIYEWRAPTNLQRTFNYLVELVYDITTTVETGESGSSTTTSRSTITKNYTQLVFGNWSKWADELRERIYKRG